MYLVVIIGLLILLMSFVISAQKRREDAMAASPIPEWAVQIEKPASWREYHTKVVGVTFCNDDGTSRQNLISECRSGDSLRLMPIDYQGELAIGVMHRVGLLGYLPRGAYPQAGHVLTSAHIKEITGGGRKYQGVNLYIREPRYGRTKSQNTAREAGLLPEWREFLQRH